MQKLSNAEAERLANEVMKEILNDVRLFSLNVEHFGMINDTCSIQ